MDNIIPVLAIDFRPTSCRDDSYVSLCDTMHVSFILMETAIYFRRTNCQSEEQNNLDFLEFHDVERTRKSVYFPFWRARRLKSVPNSIKSCRVCSKLYNI